MCYVRITQQKDLKNKETYTMNRNIQGKLKQASEAHRNSIQKSLQHRLEVARSKGDENLIRQLEAEIDYYN